MVPPVSSWSPGQETWTSTRHQRCQFMVQKKKPQQCGTLYSTVNSSVVMEIPSICPLQSLNKAWQFKGKLSSCLVFKGSSLALTPFRHILHAQVDRVSICTLARRSLPAVWLGEIWLPFKEEQAGTESSVQVPW